MQQLENLRLLFEFLLQGVGVTVAVTLIALAIGFILGILMAVFRVYGGPILSGLAAGYSLIIRGVPVIVIIFILYFVITDIVDLSPFLAGSLALGFASGAYQSEIFRGAIQSVPSGQLVAARAIGMSRIKAIRYIILPQAIRLAIPAWSNEATLVLKDSTLVYVIGVPEILRRAEYVSSRTLEPFMAFGAAAALYLALTLITSQVLDTVERRTKVMM